MPRIATFIGLLTITGCAVTNQERSVSEVAAFKAELASQPAACANYRMLYVRGFKANVEAISESNDAAKKAASNVIDQSNAVLLDAEVSEQDCSRPYCIIEPLQGGKLDAWCGYRLPADQGPELYQWISWSEADSQNVGR